MVTHITPTLPTTPIYASLYRPALFLGIEHTIAILEGTFVVALIVGIGFHLLTIVIAGIVVGVVHPTMAALTTRDPLVSRVYLRTLTSQDYYPARPLLTGRRLPVHSAIPSTH